MGFLPADTVVIHINDAGKKAVTEFYNGAVQPDIVGSDGQVIVSLVNLDHDQANPLIAAGGGNFDALIGSDSAGIHRQRHRHQRQHRHIIGAHIHA